MFRSPKQGMASSSHLMQQNALKRPRQVKKCTYLYYECPLPCIQNYKYCIRHILEDPQAPFRQCTFQLNNNTRTCLNAAAKLDKRENNHCYCTEHARRAQQAKVKSTAKQALPETPESMLLNLKHYVKPTDPNGSQNVEPLDPFVDIVAAKVNAKASEILDYASSSDSDAEPTLVHDTVRQTFDDSDEETIPGTEDDPLRHAGIFTAEEVVSLTRDKLLRLQSLYIDEFRRLRYLLKEKRRKYLHALKKEKETLCSIHNQAKTTAREKKVYLKLKALHNYHKRNGVEAILYKKSLEKRAATTQHSQKTPNVPKCIFMEGGVKCGERTLPSAKYCRKHILKDTHQVLFKACGAVESDTMCHEPVPVIFDMNCVFHMNLPAPPKIEPMKFKENIPQVKQEDIKDSIQLMGPGDYSEIDPDDDMAGLMREMKDINNKKSNSSFNDCVNSEASTDTAFSLSAQLSDRDDLLST